MDWNNPWLVGIVAPLIVLLIVGIISWFKRDLPDKKVLLNWAEDYRKEKRLPEGSIGWGRFDNYEAKGLKPVYFYPYKLWFRQKIRCKEMILVFRSKK